MTAITPAVALLERALRVVRLMEAENTRLKAERDLQRGDIALLRRRTEQLEQELQAARAGRSELVEQVIDWLEQGEEIVRAGLGTPEPLSSGQVARAAVRSDFAELQTGQRERMGTADFARTFGGTAKAAPAQDVDGKS